MVHCIPHGRVAGYGHVAHGRSSTCTTSALPWLLWNRAPPRLAASHSQQWTLPCKRSHPRLRQAQLDKESRCRLARGHESICLESQLSQVVGTLFLFLWKMIGLLTWPIWLLHPRSRRHMRGLLAPEPGRTWIHGASAGEQVIAKVLAQAMTPHAWRTHMSMRTQMSGSFPAPLDLPIIFARWLDRARPSRLILVEAELWPGWIAACRARKIPIIVIGSRPSASLRRWQSIPGLWAWLSRDVLFLPQSEIDLKLGGQPPTSSFNPIGRPSSQPARELRRSAVVERMDLGPDAVDPSATTTATDPEVHQLVESSQFRGLEAKKTDTNQIDVLILDTMGDRGLFSSAHGVHWRNLRCPARWSFARRSLPDGCTRHRWPPSAVQSSRLDQWMVRDGGHFRKAERTCRSHPSNLGSWTPRKTTTAQHPSPHGSTAQWPHPTSPLRAPLVMALCSHLGRLNRRKQSLADVPIAPSSAGGLSWRKWKDPRGLVGGPISRRLGGQQGLSSKRKGPGSANRFTP